MVQKGDYNIGDIYQGGYSSFKPSYGDVFTGYHVPTGEVGAPTKPDTANQIQQVNQLLNQGIVPIEVGSLQPEVFDQIPKTHFKEINRMSKLTGAKISVHAPLIEPSGIGEQGWSETQRELAERQLSDVINKSVEMDDKGGMPIVIHSSGLPGTEYRIKDGKREIDKLLVVDRDTGKIVQALEPERLYYPDSKQPREDLTEKQIQQYYKGEIGEEQIYEKVDLEKGKYLSPEHRLNTLNHTQWDNSLSQLIFNKERADEILHENYQQIAPILPGIIEGKYKLETLPEPAKRAYSHFKNAEIYLEDTKQNVEALFNKAWKNTEGDDKQREMLKALSQNFQKDLNKNPMDPLVQSEAIQNLLLGLKQKVQPKLFVPVEEFAVEKSSKTFANVAFNAFEKHGDKAPTIAIENMFPGMAFASGQGMDQLITKSKEQFVKKAREKGYSESEAKRQADKIIGMTLDVGHLNIAKKKGFQDKDLMKEVEEIAKHVKHVHLTDNFGYSDSHLPPGMGNVPIGKILERLEKEGYEGRKIVEAGGFVQHFGQSPYLSALEGLGSPIYQDGISPYWNQTIGLQQGYFSGYGQMLPQGHFETYGIPSFSNLPIELGGQKAGAQGSRMSGHGME